MKYLVGTILITTLFLGCISATNNQPEYLPSRVLERIAQSTQSPGWASGAMTFYEDRGDINYIETVTMSGNARPEACNHAAADLGRVQILRQIRDAITSSGQVVESAVTADPAVERLMAFLSQGQLSGVKLVGRYWERREESDASGNRVLRVLCASKIAIPRSLLEAQLRAATNGGAAGNPEIRQKLLDAQKAFLDNISQADRQAQSPTAQVPNELAAKYLPSRASATPVLLDHGGED